MGAGCIAEVFEKGDRAGAGSNAEIGEACVEGAFFGFFNHHTTEPKANIEIVYKNFADAGCVALVV